MASKSFPFFSLDPSAPKRPLVPFDFPKGKNVYCLIDSGANISIISENIRHHEDVLIRPGSRLDRLEGICGNKCFQTIGETAEVSLGIAGLSTVAKINFTVSSNDHKVNEPVIGTAILDFFDIQFVKQDGKYVTIITER